MDYKALSSLYGTCNQLGKQIKAKQQKEKKNGVKKLSIFLSSKFIWSLHAPPQPRVEHFYYSPQP